MTTVKPVSLTTFLDFVVKAGPPKYTIVSNFKNADDYSPATDFYKQFRDELASFHKKGSGSDFSALQAWASAVHENKRAAYLALVSGYKRFLGKKEVSWVLPKKVIHTIGGLSVRVNPELGLQIEGIPHLIKLYLKEDPLTKTRIQGIIYLMQAALFDAATPQTFAVLDVRKGKLHTAGNPSPQTQILLVGEAASFKSMLDAIPNSTATDGAASATR